MHRKTRRTQYSALPTHCADSLADHQSEIPMAQTADSQPLQTLHVESEQTTSAQLRKLPMQLNTPNIFVPDLVQVSLNASDVHWLGRCVPAFKHTCTKKAMGPGDPWRKSVITPGPKQLRADA